ncbi:thiamine phosphate synthase [Roseicella sp. DB1501]|nr:thiamine phosphate synthase [Roseicella sp. DB1501]
MNRRHGFDPTLCLVTDPHLVGQRSVENVALAAVRGGATMVQLRDKAASTRALLEVAVRLKAALAPLGVPLLVNDRVDVALAARADGVHLGQSDMPASEARRLLGPDAVIGVSVVTEADAASIDRGAVDYVGLGPVFQTDTKVDAPVPVSPETRAVLVRALAPLPVMAIGGVTAENLAPAIRDGAAGVAVISAICSTPDPEVAAHCLREAVEAARAERRRSNGGAPAV